MKYFISGMLLAVFVVSGAIGLVYQNKAQAYVNHATVDCSWSEIKDCYNGGQNRCCPGTKGDG
ncbi:hypothetical protein HOD19_02810 [bacterium]|jgi:hypothetical protein|nr:hypothetical protein [bacterium]